MAFLPMAKNVFCELLLLAYLDLIISSRHLLLKAGNLAMGVFALAKKSLSFSLITLAYTAQTCTKRKNREMCKCN